MNNKKNIIYLLNGSIGDFLMSLVLMQEIYKQDKGMRFDLIISTPRNISDFKELATEYDYIKIIGQSPVSFLPFFLKRNNVMLPPTPGKHPFHIKVFSVTLSFFGSLIKFKKTEEGIKNRGDVLFDLRKLYPEILMSVLQKIGLKEVSPNTNLLFSKNIENFENKPYIVFHPWGSGSGRSFPNKKIELVVLEIKKKFPMHRILLSGSKEDAKKFISNIKGVSVIAGKYSLSQMVSVISGADMYIGVDTGITHLASVMNKKSIVIAEQGTPHWLPYYNLNALILYSIQGDTGGVNVGREYLESQRKGRVRYLERVPISVIRNTIRGYEIF